MKEEEIAGHRFCRILFTEDDGNFISIDDLKTWVNNESNLKELVGLLHYGVSEKRPIFEIMQRLSMHPIYISECKAKDEMAAMRGLT